MLRFLISMAFLLAGIHLNAQDNETTAFSLQDCIDYALEHNPSLRISGLERNISKTQVGETRAQGLPQINVEGRLSHNFEEQKMIIDPSKIFGGDSTGGNGGENNEEIISFSIPYEGSAALSITQLLFNGSYFVGLQAAQTYRQLADKEYVKSRIDIVENVTKAYYSALISRERLELAGSNVNRLDTLFRETQVMYKNGFAEKIDVDRIRVQLNNTNTQFKTLQRLDDVNLMLLKFQMGMPVHESLQLSGSINEIDLEAEPELSQKTFQYGDRIEIQQLEVNESLAKLDLKNNVVQYLPQLNAFLNYGFNTGTYEFNRLFSFGDRWLSYGAYGISVSIPVFDGLAKSYRIQRNRIQLEQLAHQKKLLQSQINFEVEQAYAVYRNSTEMMASQKENLELANEVYRVTKIKYQEGMGSNLEVVEAETAYKEAETNYYNALYDALIAKVDLEKALGILNKETKN